MGLKGTIQSLVTTAFDIVGDLKTQVDVQYILGVGTYDHVTDTETQATASSSSIQVIFTNFDFNEIDSSVIVETDMKVLVDASKLGGNVPKVTDVILETSRNITWNILRVKSVPGNSLYIIHVRKV
jgi:hypothetical protein